MHCILISACLLGQSCRYDKKHKEYPPIEQLRTRKDLILVPVCPEQAGGLPTPRCPSERCGSQVISADGTDVTAAYRFGADQALRLCRLYGCNWAILKEKSPSCGSGWIYDGTFTHTLTAGDGVTTERLRAAGIRVVGEQHLDDLLQQLERGAQQG